MEGESRVSLKGEDSSSMPSVATENLDNKNSHANPSKDAVPVRIALFSVMGFSIYTAVCEMIDQREDVELAVVVICTGPKSRRSNAHLEVLQALWETGHYNTDVIVSNKKSKYSESMML